MDSYSCILSLTEIEHLHDLLKSYEADANGSGVVHFYKYRNVAITVYKTNLVRFQGQSIIHVVEELLGQIRNEPPSKITLTNNKTGENRVFNDDDLKQFEKVLEVIETPQKKCSVHATSLKNLSRILAFRFSYLISKGNVTPTELVVVTTTKKEKELIKREIINLLPDVDLVPDSYFSTLHAFCLRLLNNNREKLGYKNTFTWMSNVKKEIIVKNICEKIGINKNEEFCKNIVEINTVQKSNDLVIEEALKRVWPERDWIPFKEKVAAFNDEYNRWCLESGELDFNDMLVFARNALRQFPAVKLEFPQKILCGDSGWINQIEHELLSLIAKKTIEFFIVRLDDQNYQYGEVIKKLHTGVGFSRSIKELTLVTDQFLSNEGGSFKKSLVRDFLCQRYSKAVLEKIKQSHHCTRDREYQLFGKNSHEVKTNSWSKSKALSANELIEIGCDEVGVGDYFGGIVTAAVALQPGQLTNLPLDSIKDSKLLTNEQIVDLYKQLKGSVRFSVTELTPSEYNQLYDDYHNANIIKVYAHNKALVNLIDQKRIDLEKACIVMDQFSKPSYYKQYLDKIQSAQKIEINLFKTHAEAEYVSVALASIFARYHFLEQIKKMQKKSSILIPLGASDPKVKTSAEKIYEKHGIEGLKQFVKFHFSFTESIVKTNPARNLFSK